MATFLPPYSPDMNPIELAFSKLKAHMKRLAIRTVDGLCKGVGEILKLFSKQQYSNFFAASGYGPNSIGNALDFTTTME